MRKCSTNEANDKGTYTFGIMFHHNFLIKLKISHERFNRFCLEQLK